MKSWFEVLFRVILSLGLVPGSAYSKTPDPQFSNESIKESVQGNEVQSSADNNKPIFEFRILDPSNPKHEGLINDQSRAFTQMQANVNVQSSLRDNYLKYGFEMRDPLTNGKMLINPQVSYYKIDLPSSTSPNVNIRVIPDGFTQTSSLLKEQKRVEEGRRTHNVQMRLKEAKEMVPQQNKIMGIQVLCRMGVNLMVPTLVAYYELGNYDHHFLFQSAVAGGVAGALYSGASQLWNTPIERLIGEHIFKGYIAMQIAYIVTITASTWGAQYLLPGALDFVDWNYLNIKVVDILSGALTSIFLQGTWFASNLFKSRMERAEVHKMYDGDNIIDKETHDLLLKRAIIRGDTRQFWNSMINNTVGLALMLVQSPVVSVPAFLMGSAGAINAFRNWMKLHPDHRLTERVGVLSDFISELGLNKKNARAYFGKMGIDSNEVINKMHQVSADFILRLDPKLGFSLTNIDYSPRPGYADLNNFQNENDSSKVIHQKSSSSRPRPELKIFKNTCNMIFN